MNELRIIKKGDILYADSRTVAPAIGLEHDALLAGINHMVDVLRDNEKDISDKFIPCKQGGNVVWYRLSRSGCDMVAAELTPDETTRILFINEYTNTFRHRERKLKNLLSAEWQEKRKLNATRQTNFHDTIKELVTYAEQMGSRNANFYYTDYNRLLNRTVGLMDGERDEATTMQLENLNKANIWAGEIIKQGIANNDDYHDIYKAVKQRMKMFAEFLEMTLPKLSEGE